MKMNNKIFEGYRQEYRRKGYWGDATLEDYWNLAVLRTPDKLYVTDYQGQGYSYAKLDQQAERLAAWLRANGTKPGDIISFQIPGWSEFMLIYIACLKAGAVVNPILACYRLKELVYILNKCNSKFFFCPSVHKNFVYMDMQEELLKQVPGLQRVVVVDKEKELALPDTLRQILKYTGAFPMRSRRTADDLAAVIFTSGTEGFPKGVMLTHNNILASERSFISALHLCEHDRILLPGPTAHAIGFHHGATTTFLLGATIHLQDIYKIRTTVEIIERERCTCCMGPTPFVFDMLRLLEQEKHDISSLRLFICGGAVITKQVFEKAHAYGINVVDVYGSTEAVPHAVFGRDPSIKNGPMPGIEVKIVDKYRQEVADGEDGEEASRGPNVFAGYLGDTKITDRVLDEDGWFYSGDICRKEKDGSIHVTGRKKDIIIRGGENLSCTEIEEAILLHPNVNEAAAVGMPDERLGERICAYIVLFDVRTGLNIDELQKIFKQNDIAKTKCPERLEFLQELPRTSSGKVRKNILRQDIAAKLKEEGKFHQHSLEKAGKCYAS